MEPIVIGDPQKNGAKSHHNSRQRLEQSRDHQHTRQDRQRRDGKHEYGPPVTQHDQEDHGQAKRRDRKDHDQVPLDRLGVGNRIAMGTDDMGEDRLGNRLREHLVEILKHLFAALGIPHGDRRLGHEQEVLAGRIDEKSLFDLHVGEQGHGPQLAQHLVAKSKGIFGEPFSQPQSLRTGESLKIVLQASRATCADATWGARAAASSSVNNCGMCA